MEPASLLVFLLIVFVVVASLASRQQRARETLESLARRLGGRLDHPGFFTPGKVHFSLDGRPAQITYHPGSKHTPAHTRLQVFSPCPGTLRLVPEGFFTGLKKFFGAQDIEVGDPSFDALFLVQGAPGKWVAEVLEPEAREGAKRLLESGRSLLSSAPLRIEAGPPGVTVRIGRCLAHRPPELDRFVDDACAFARRIWIPAADGVKFLDEVAVVPSGDCPVCGQGMSESLTVCRACRTPHHVDCWQYFGGCAVYACRSRKGTARRAAERA